MNWTRVGGCACGSEWDYVCISVFVCSEITSRYAYYFWPLEPSLGWEKRERERERERKRENKRERERGEIATERLVSCVYTPQGFESGRVPILPLSLSLSGGWGQVSPTVVSAGCVAACLYWSPDFLVAACTYLNIPPAAALCSRPHTASLSPSPRAALCSALLCSAPGWNASEKMTEKKETEKEAEFLTCEHSALFHYMLHPSISEWRVPEILRTLTSADCFCTYADVKFVI